MISNLLLYPFESDTVAFPTLQGSTLICNAPYSDGFDQFSNSDVVQHHYPYATIFEQQGFNIQQSLDDKKKYDLILYAIPQQKAEAQYMLARLTESLSDNGMIVAAAMNDAGGKRLPKWFTDLGIENQNLSKSKGRVVWAHKQTINEARAFEWIIKGKTQSITLDEQEFTTKPGVFGWNKIDQGSKILIESLPDSLFGKGADYGCGYGYLSYQVLNRFSGIQKLYAMDADYHALECAQQNLSSFNQVEYRWCDLTKSQEGLDPLDFIVMNPPFHDSKLTAASIGVNFIKMAASRLKKNKNLYIVANSHLPYEKNLTEFFHDVQKIEEKSGFKVFSAVK